MTGVILIYNVMKDFLLTALAYAGWFFVACAAVVALTWFALGLWNLAKIYYLAAAENSITLTRYDFLKAVVLIVVVLLAVYCIWNANTWLNEPLGGSVNPILFHR